jgi:predicted nucleotide-binding protein
MDKKKPITARMLAAATSSALPAVIRGLQRIGIDVPDPDTPLDIEEPPSAPARPQVFLVHGHDQLRDKVEAFLGSLDLKPVRLDDEPARGKTIIEMLEEHGAAAYAVVLLTPDDEGRKKSRKETPLQPRARQNVILELGYFMGRLGRARVCAIHAANVELPSDVHGVRYIKLDRLGAWKRKVERELKAAGVLA